MATDQDIRDPKLDHLFDGDDSMNVYSKTYTNLSAGTPGPDILSKCIEIFREATEHRMSEERENAFLFQYGITAGQWEYRQELATFLTSHYRAPVNRADLVLTCGATHGLQLAMGTFLDPRAIIFVEDVTYMIALDAFKQYPLMRIVSVQMNKDGVDTKELEKIAAAEKSQWHHTTERPFWAMFYTIPTFHNPTGACMSEECCRQVVRISKELNLLVVCDDVYNLLYYGSECCPPKRLFAYDDPGMSTGNVLSNGTFSKIMAPGLRLGWLELPPKLAVILRDSGILRSGGSANNYVSGIVRSILELGFADKHLAFLLDVLRDRMTSLCNVLDANLPPGCVFQRPSGGYFIWIELPINVDAAAFTKWCHVEHKVSAIHGARFDPNGGHANYLRLSIAFHSREKLVAAGKTLCSALREFFERQNSVNI